MSKKNEESTFYSIVVYGKIVELSYLRVKVRSLNMTKRWR